jgi:hypothetical protein
MRNGSKIRLLTEAVIGLQSAMIAKEVSAQQSPVEPMIEFSTFFYEDWQRGSQDRMQVFAPVSYFQLPLSESWSTRGSVVYDSMSGASPMYHDTLSGASGLGIEDNRWAGNLMLTKGFEGFDLSVGLETSSEDDFTAYGGSLASTVWSADKNSSLQFGFSHGYDEITSTNNPLLDENRQTWGGLVGVTQVLSKSSIIQFNLSYSTSDGYLTDQYKSNDKRPASRDMYAALARYNHFFSDYNGSLHVDFRTYYDSWDIRNQMIELAWYQELGSTWIIRPLARYVTQTEAFFYNPLFPPDTSGFFSADQRMGGFGGVSGGLKFVYKLSKSLDLTALYEYFHQRSNLSLGTPGSASIPPLSGHIYGIGLITRW